MGNDGDVVAAAAGIANAPSSRQRWSPPVTSSRESTTNRPPKPNSPRHSPVDTMPRTSRPASSTTSTSTRSRTPKTSGSMKRKPSPAASARSNRGRRGRDRPRARTGDPPGDRGDRGARARDGPAGPVEARPGEATSRPARAGGGRGRGLVKPPIQEIFRRGDEVLVQVIKESIGTKGPTLSTYISIPGRYLVLMPGLNRVGVSRKIVDEGQRRKLREIMHELNPPKGLGFIVRTAGLERTKRELARDLAYLLRLWKVILRRIKRTRAPGADLPGIGHDHPDHPRHLHLRDRHDLDRRARGLRAGPGVPARRHAPVRQPAQALRREGPALPQVRHRGRDRQDPAPARTAARGGLDRHRPDRGPGGHRRQLGQLPGRGRCRADRLRDEPAARPRRSPASSGSATSAA